MMGIYADARIESRLIYTRAVGSTKAGAIKLRDARTMSGAALLHLR